MNNNIHYKIFNAILIIPSFLITSLFLFLTIDFLIGNTSETINTFQKNYIITGVELQFFSILCKNIISVLKNIFVASLLFGFFIVLMDYIESKIKAKNKTKLLTIDDATAKSQYHSFYRGFTFGFFKLPSILMLLFLLHFYFYDDLYIPTINSPILLDKLTLIIIEKTYMLISFIPLLFLFSGVTFGSLFVLANESKNK